MKQVVNSSIDKQIFLKDITQDVISHGSNYQKSESNKSSFEMYRNIESWYITATNIVL